MKWERGRQRGRGRNKEEEEMKRRRRPAKLNPAASTSFRIFQDDVSPALSDLYGYSIQLYLYYGQLYLIELLGREKWSLPAGSSLSVRSNTWKTSQNPLFCCLGVYIGYMSMVDIYHFSDDDFS